MNICHNNRNPTSRRGAAQPPDKASVTVAAVMRRTPALDPPSSLARIGKGICIGIGMGIGIGIYIYI